MTYRSGVDPTIERRLRSDGPDFEQFHRSLEDDPRLVALAAHVPAGSSVGFQLDDGRNVVFGHQPDRVVVEVDGDIEGTNCVVALDEAAWFAYASQECEVFALTMVGRASFAKGDMAGFGAWMAVLKQLYFDHPVYEPPSEPFATPPTFTLADDDSNLRQALDHYGFVLVKSVFDEAEVAEMRSDVDAATAAATPDDGRSWWATLDDGSEVCCRVNYLSDRSAKIDSLTTDERILRIGRLGGADLQCYDKGEDGHSAVIKHHGVSAGLADLPWHIDCGNGGHHLLCPGVNVGVQLHAATSDSGQLHFLPGSTGTTLRGFRPRRDWQTFAIETDPGDVTVHYCHTWHSAPPPAAPGPGRTAMYLSFHRAELGEVTGPYAAYNDILFSSGTGRIRV